MEGNSKSKKRHARSGSGSTGALAAFFRSTVASFSTTTATTTTTKKRSSFNHRNAFSGPIMVVPPEARGRRSRGGHRSGYRTPEPSSPKVSCIGQIKKSRSKPRNKVKPCGEDGGGACPLPPRPPPHGAAGSKPKTSLVRRIFFRRSRSRSSSSSKSSSTGMTAAAEHGFKRTAVSTAPAPVGGLGQMKRFTSGRTAFQDFDWRDEPLAAAYNDDYDDDYEDDGFVAHSAPLVLGGGMVASEPRKEVNLWRRRPMSPPTPLELP